MGARRKPDATAPPVVYIRTLTTAEVDALDAVVDARNAADPGVRTSRDRVAAQWIRERLAAEAAKGTP